MVKNKSLSDLESELRGNINLPLMESNLVFGEGNPNSDVLFIGEAPGIQEDKEERPFVGRSGKMLDKMIEDMGWKREQFYITNIVKRRPPNNRDPLPEEIAAYKPYLEKQLAIIEPKVIIPLGRYAMNYFLPNEKISQAQGKVFWWHNILLMPIYHPAAALRRATLVDDIKNAFTKIPKLIDGYEDLLKKKTEKTSQTNQSTSEQINLFS